MDENDLMLENDETVDFLSAENGTDQSAVNFSSNTQKDKFVGGSTSEPEENLEARKSRVRGLWSAWKEVQKAPALVSLFVRKDQSLPDVDPKNLLQEHGYPSRTKIADLEFETWTVNLDQKFVKDGYMYLLRGDHPGLDKKGFYSRPYGYGKKTTEQLTHDLKSSNEVGYFLYEKEAYLKTAEPSSSSIAQELAYKQSQVGGSSFISGTTNLEAAIAGTDNQPDPEEQSRYEVYVLKVPVESVINSNTNNHFGMEENEYLVSDYITPDEIVAKFSRDQREAIYQYMHAQLGISREDLGMGS
jgi:hypothetical protein